MWNVKTKVIPIIRGVNRAISKSFTKYVSYIPAKHEVKDYRKLHTYFGKYLRESTIDSTLKLTIQAP